MDLHSEVSDYRATAIVDQTGFVRSLTVQYRLGKLGNPNETVPARFHMEFIAIGEENVSITPPDWVETARNQTEGTETETANETKG